LKAALMLTAKEEAMPSWHFSGDYFENCNCSVVCPCFVSKAAPLTSRPTEGVCDVALIFHIESGSYDRTTLDGLNVAVAVHTPGPMGEGNRLPLTSINVPTINRLKPWAQSSPVRPADQWRNWHRYSVTTSG
jgi:hypothetical protein